MALLPGVATRKRGAPDRMSARRRAIETIANHKVGASQEYLELAGADIFGQYVFGDAGQRAFLAKPIYQKLRETIEGRAPFDPLIVDAVAHGVKEWALAQ